MQTTLSHPLEQFRHKIGSQHKSKVTSHSSENLHDRIAMTELARQIIRQQWQNRHHPDATRRKHAQSLIRTHVIMLRQWRGAAG